MFLTISELLSDKGQIILIFAFLCREASINRLTSPIFCNLTNALSFGTRYKISLRGDLAKFSKISSVLEGFERTSKNSPSELALFVDIAWLFSDDELEVISRDLTSTGNVSPITT